MSSASLTIAFLRLPTDVPPEPQPVDLSSGDWALPLLVGVAVLVVLAVVVAVVLRRRRPH